MHIGKKNKKKSMSNFRVNVDDKSNNMNSDSNKINNSNGILPTAEIHQPTIQMQTIYVTSNNTNGLVSPQQPQQQIIYQQQPPLQQHVFVQNQVYQPRVIQPQFPTYEYDKANLPPSVQQYLMPTVKMLHYTGKAMLAAHIMILLVGFYQVSQQPSLDFGFVAFLVQFFGWMSLGGSIVSYTNGRKISECSTCEAPCCTSLTTICFIILTFVTSMTLSYNIRADCLPQVGPDTVISGLEGCIEIVPLTKQNGANYGNHDIQKDLTYISCRRYVNESYTQTCTIKRGSKTVNGHTISNFNDCGVDYNFDNDHYSQVVYEFSNWDVCYKVLELETHCSCQRRATVPEHEFIHYIGRTCKGDEVAPCQHCNEKMCYRHWCTWTSEISHKKCDSWWNLHETLICISMLLAIMILVLSAHSCCLSIPLRCRYRKLTNRNGFCCFKESTCQCCCGNCWNSCLEVEVCSNTKKQQ